MKRLLTIALFSCGLLHEVKPIDLVSFMPQGVFGQHLQKTVEPLRNPAFLKNPASLENEGRVLVGAAREKENPHVVVGYAMIHTQKGLQQFQSQYPYHTITYHTYNLYETLTPSFPGEPSTPEEPEFWEETRFQ